MERIFARLPARLEEPGSTRVAVAFRVGLGIVFVCAFASLRTQVDGLFGAHGVTPIAELVAEARGALGPWGFLRLPTLFWLGASDAALHRVADLGIVLGVLFALGIAPKFLLALLWACWLSFVSAGDVFMGYQWDALLLETAACAFFLVPLWPLPTRRPDAPPAAGIWLLRCLLFKLMFLSGMVKLSSGDAAWRSLDALSYHFWSQPLPAWTAWYAAKAPAFVLKGATLAMFAIELVAPFLVFGPRPARRVAFASLVLLQVAIAATGSYGFFNLLTIVLALVALDDELAARIVRPWHRAAAPSPVPAPRPAVRDAVALLDRILAVAGFVLVLPLSLALGFFPGPSRAIRPLRAVEHFDTFNTYGLFAVMTTDRLEITLEGSRDGRTWTEIPFRWKPGDPSKAPRYPAPHQPRLDWQMWFASLGDCAQNPWFLRFQQRLLEGRPEVWALVAKNPFPDAPPRYLRTFSVRYRFTDRGPDWWTREGEGDYCPPVDLVDGRLHAAELP